MSWIYLLLAGACEVGWAVALKYSQGFTRLRPSVVVLTAGLVSFYLLSLAAKTIPIGTAYAIWTGIGAAGTAAAGIFLFAEPRSWATTNLHFGGCDGHRRPTPTLTEIANP